MPMYFTPHVYFKLGEKIRALEYTTATWQEAHILGFEDDWTVRLQWAFSRKFISTLSVPPRLRRSQIEDWPFQQWIGDFIPMNSKRRRLTINTVPINAPDALDYNPDNRAINDPIFYEQIHRVSTTQIVLTTRKISRFLITYIHLSMDSSFMFFRFFPKPY